MHGATGKALRRRLAATAYARTGAYDAAIAGWLAGQVGESFPRRIAVGGELKQMLRYGENPHQAAALYLSGQPRPGVATARQLQGKELRSTISTTPTPPSNWSPNSTGRRCAIIKHANPCGVAEGADHDGGLSQGAGLRSGQRLRRHHRAQPAAGRPRRREEIAKLFTEVVIAPGRR